MPGIAGLGWWITYRDLVADSELYHARHYFDDGSLQAGVSHQPGRTLSGGLKDGGGGPMLEPFGYCVYCGRTTRQACPHSSWNQE